MEMGRDREGESIYQSHNESPGYLHERIVWLFEFSIRTYSIPEDPRHPSGNVIQY